MPILDTRQLPVIEKLPGWRGRLFHSPSLTFGHWDFSAGSSVHEHFHPQEEVWEILEGELEMTIDGAAQVVGPGMVAIVPANVIHSVRARSDGKAIVVDYPLRTDF
jgi:quercetin dioxygenase-like cupin family protein